MGALAKWRQATLKHRNHGTVSRSPSPAASAKSDDDEPLSSGDEGAKDVPRVQNARTTSLSWIRWWNRSHRTRASSEQRVSEARPAIPERSSEHADAKQVESHTSRTPFIYRNGRCTDPDNKTFRYRSVTESFHHFRSSCYLYRYSHPRSHRSTRKGAP